MNIVTVINYPDDAEYNKMLKLWMYLLQKHARNATLIIIHGDNELSSSVRDYFKRFDNSELTAGEYSGKRSLKGKYEFFVDFKMYNTCRLTEPFIYIDADAFVLSDLSYLWERRNLKPRIGTPMAVSKSTIPT